MSATTKDDVNKEKDVVLDTASGKKNHWQRNVIMILILAVSLWAFWTYSPIVASLKSQVLALNSGQQVEELTQPTVSSAVEQTAPSHKDIRSLPTFDSLVDNAAVVGPTSPIASSAAVPNQLRAQHQTPQNQHIYNQETQHALTALQQQVAQLNTQLNDLQHQQVQQTQMQIRGQLFAALVQASSAESSLHDRRLAWKSITFMPLIHDDKRNFAREAVSSLQAIQEMSRAEENEVKLLLQALSQQLDVAALPSPTKPTNMDPYAASSQAIVVKRTWLDWLSEQFKVSKVQPSMSQAKPNHSIQQLMYQLQQYQQWIQQEQWQNHFPIAALIYQLDQRGITSSLSSQDLPAAQGELQNWQEQARLWMESL